VGKIRLFILLLIFSSLSIFSQDSGEGSQFNLNGSMRFRSFDLGRDIPLSRQTQTYPVYDIPKEYKTIGDNIKESYEENLENLKLGKPGQVYRKKERLNFMDTRILLNFEFKTSRNFDGVVGVQIGDIPFGGRGLITNGPQANLTNSLDNGGGAGGEMFQASPINLQTNLLYLNYRIPEKDFFSRFGIQLFSSPQGRVLFTRGAGTFFSKDFKEDKITLEWGWIRGRERQIADIDNNGFNDRYGQNSNIFFAKLKNSKIQNFKNEIYSIASKDNDPTDLNNETGLLHWHGIFNEFTFENFNLIIHGVYNHGKIKSPRRILDEDQDLLYEKLESYKISGALGDIQVTYFYDNSINFNFITIGTTGRPGIDRDGLDGTTKNGGYRTLAPLYAISNLGVDFTGGYALFTAGNMNGLYEPGTFVNYIVGPVMLTLGYYQLHASRAPRLSTNREFNSLTGQKSSTFLGDEYNFNIRWNIYSDFMINFRSGIFFPHDGYRALTDSMGGSYAREAFISGEYKF
jgi:hypothetical protein